MRGKMGLDIKKVRVRNALNSAKKRGLLSINHIQDDSGEVMDAYSMKDVRFANPPEIAHIKSVLPLLLEDTASKKIMSDMEEIHEEE